MNIRSIFTVVILLAFSAPAGNGEIVERELGTDDAGNPVTGYVFQAGRGFKRSSYSSGLRRRSYSPLRNSGRVLRSSTSPAYFYVPIVPLHCRGSHGSTRAFSVWRIPRAQTGSFSVTVIR
ncbi:MAG: hypothetical protein HKN23_00560 [Verrucomicrobiales bacterium]|nr:hypothetical protein [Verrucomicrobiales bacterium]